MSVASLVLVAALPVQADAVCPQELVMSVGQQMLVYLVETGDECTRRLVTYDSFQQTKACPCGSAPSPDLQLTTSTVSIPPPEWRVVSYFNKKSGLHTDETNEPVAASVRYKVTKTDVLKVVGPDLYFQVYTVESNGKELFRMAFGVTTAASFIEATAADTEAGQFATPEGDDPEKNELILNYELSGKSYDVHAFMLDP